ncbi:DUF2157 domain-containing protein [Sphingobacterium sp. DK4209]|uniref:DUF2157 domain-containing protein n=1 Tax=Sphingobacterium zhuxiongii TaxID=2662364 RepID=A0A5Q0Q873_9SPHI|nr:MULTISPECIES: DUF2157 domain-containing protein [unclassified Sphingobacterium]MVZ64981.1 DUF2157 domain-containing protein [Sphingobacterium sp. DK4209]QGA25319.1 DUF2157 domain-containing protein [Sphingobacterium sp. dk4302]
MKKLDVSKNEREIIEDALSHWQSESLLDAEKVRELKDNLDEKGFEWGVLARYAFWVALASLIFSVVSLFSDDYLSTLIERFYDTPNVVFCLVFAGLAAIFYILGFRNKQKNPEKTFSNETLMLAGSFSTAACIGFLGQILDRSDHYFTILFFLSIVIYGVLSVKLSSKLIWVFTLVALGIWFATETALHSNWGFKFWGMNYPLRFTIFGGLLTVFAVFAQDKIKPIQPFKSTTYVIGLLYSMIALWLLSIFGNYSDLEKWSSVRQYEIFYWGLLGIVVSLGLALYGMKNKDNVSRDIGFVFFILNLYTRFVEYLWDNINRTVFFLVLAISFWFVGQWAEKIWKKKDKG